MEEKLSLEEMKTQLKTLEREQNETENAYKENQGLRDKSILADWLKEILAREEKINALKQNIATASQPVQTTEKTAEMPEETRLVDVSKLTPLQWLRQKINKMRMSLKKDVLEKAPGIPKEKLENLREEKIKRYREMLSVYQNEKNPSEEKTFDEWLSKGVPTQEEQKTKAEEWKYNPTGKGTEKQDLEPEE